MKATKQDLINLDRLLKRSDFLRVNNNPRKWVSKSMVVLAVPNEAGKKRVGITVTKRLEKTAVGRNRMKRRLRAVAADILPNGAKSDMDYVLVAREGAATHDYEDLKKDLRWCLEKLGYAAS
jgi:ribonuclease P protein component